GVVAGVGKRHQAQVDIAAVGPARDLAAEEAVGGDAAGDGEQREGALLVEAVDAVDELSDGGGAEGGEEVANRLRRVGGIDREPSALERFEATDGGALEAGVGEEELGF